MQYKCEVCHDTGNKEKDMGGHLTCIACEAATDRVLLEAFIARLPAMGEQEQAWRIHQRALAMAPKQEAQEVSNFELQKLKDAAKRAGMAAHFIDGKLRDDMFIIGRDFIDRLHAELTKLCSPVAATASANGALPELLGPYCQEHEDAGAMYPDMFTGYQMRSYGQACAAAGPDAALIKALEEVIKECCAWYFELSGQDGERLPVIKKARAALSGAKGN